MRKRLSFVEKPAFSNMKRALAPKGAATSKRSIRSTLIRLLCPPPIKILLCYLMLILLFFWPTIWSGAVPLPLMNPYAQPDPIWSSYKPSDVAIGTNLLLGDISGYYYPYLHFTIASLRMGQFPLWNPHLFGGMPYFAAHQAALLYPVNLLSYWLGPHHFWSTTAILRLLIAGWGTYLLTRRLGGSVLGATLAGGAFMFTSFNVVWLHFAIHNVAALLPLALYLIVDLVDRRSRFATLALAVIIAAQLLGGHPEMSLFFMVIVTSFAIFWIAHSRTGTKHQGSNSSVFWDAIASVKPAVVLFTLAIAFGLGLATVQWLPTLDLVHKSMTLAEREFAAGHGASEFAPLGGLRRADWGNLRHWLLLVAPELWGTPQGDRIRYWLPERTNYNEMASYVGILILPLAVMGIGRGRNRQAAWFFGALLVLSLLLLYPLPIIHRIGYLPLLRDAYGFRLGLGIGIAAAVLAGMGLDWLMTAQRRGLVGMLLALVGLALLNLALIIDLWGGQRVSWALGFTPNDATRALIAQVYTFENWKLFLPAIASLFAAIVLSLAAFGRLRVERATALLTSAALVELTCQGFNHNGFTPPEMIYPRTAAIAHLTTDTQKTAHIGTPAYRSPPWSSWRVLNLDETFWANSAMIHGIQIVGGMDDLVPTDQQRFLQRGRAGIVRVGGKYIVLDWGERLMDLMSVRYVTSTRAVIHKQRGEEFPLVMRDGTAQVYRNDSALPRAYAATTVVQATSRTAEDIVFSAAFNPHRAVVLEEQPTSPISSVTTPVQPVAVVSYTPNRVELAPDLPVPAVVVLTDHYDPDWRVTIDGQPAQLLRVNGFFRGVVVPAGKHRVMFNYHPWLVEYSGGVSLMTLAVCVVWMLYTNKGRNDLEQAKA